MTGRLCAAPDCDRRIAGHNVSGVCRDHLHGAHCRCARCTGAARAGGAPVASLRSKDERESRSDGVQSVLVPVHSTFSGANLHAPFSLYDTSAVEDSDVA